MDEKKLQDAISECLRPVRAKINNHINLTRAALVLLVLAISFVAVALILCGLAYGMHKFYNLSNVFFGIAAVGFLLFIIAWTLNAFALRHSRNNSFTINDTDILQNIYEVYFRAKMPQIIVQGSKVTPQAKQELFCQMLFVLQGTTYILATHTKAKWNVLSENMNGDQSEYFVEYKLTKFKDSPQVLGDELFLITANGRLIDKKSNFVSESIAFNETFVINGQDKQAITRILTPSVITKMLALGEKVYRNKKVTIATASVTVAAKLTAQKNRHFALSDFDFTKRRYRAILSGMIDKMAEVAQVIMKLDVPLTPFSF